MEKILKICKDCLSWISHRLKHKAEHFSLKELKKILVEGGLAMLVIVITWEIIEDILFPILFGALGKFLHPAFYTLIPVSWILCLHWLVVPVVWGLWMKMKNKNEHSTK